MVNPFFGLFVITLLTIPYLLLMSIVWFNGPPYSSLDVSQTRESTKWLWVGVQGATKVLSDSPGLVELLVGLAFSYRSLPDGQAPLVPLFCTKKCVLVESS